MFDKDNWIIRDAWRIEQDAAEVLENAHRLSSKIARARYIQKRQLKMESLINEE